MKMQKTKTILGKTVLLGLSIIFGFTASVHAQAGKLETSKVKLGYIALMDFAPLAVAVEKGFFKKYGITEAEVIKQASWGATRDNLELGSENGGIDGAHILTPMSYALTLGLNTKGNQKIPMYILARLNLNNQGISVAEKYKSAKVTVDSSPLKPFAMKAKADGKPLTVAMTFPIGTHNFWVRYWLAAGGIDPDLDVNTITIPPPQMVANMKVGTMDAFCVGEPWNQQLINQKIGYTAAMTQEIWKDHPEKSFTMRKTWVDTNPNAAKAVLKAIMEAQIWADNDANNSELAKILSQKNWINVPETDILPRLKGEFVYGDGRDNTGKLPKMKYWRDKASFPYKSHDKWFLAEMRRWGYFPGGVDYEKTVNLVNRSDLWREVATELGQNKMIPKTDSRGIEVFFDGMKFDPKDPEAYLNKLVIKNIDGKKKSAVVVAPAPAPTPTQP